MYSKRIKLIVGIFALLSLSMTAQAMSGGLLTRISVNENGVQGNGGAFHPKISGDGRYIVFTSYADNLVSDDTNGTWDVFRFDRVTGTHQRITSGLGGEAINGLSRGARVSDDGCIVVFQSDATNVVPNDTNGTTDVYVYDCNTDLIKRVSEDLSGVEGDLRSHFAGVSGDGEYITFASTATNLDPTKISPYKEIFLARRDGSSMVRVSLDFNGNDSNGDSQEPVVSDDGRYVAFYSSASNLVPNDTNGHDDAFVYDSSTGIIERVSVDSSGTQGDGQGFSGRGGATAISISDDGRFVAFESYFPNLVSNDTNGTEDVFVHDRLNGTTSLVTITEDGIQPDLGTSWYEYTEISADGRYVAFSSPATNLVPNDTNNERDFFVRDMVNGTIERISESNAGDQSSGQQSGDGEVSISDSGEEVVFGSRGTNLVPNDTNGHTDVFLWGQGEPLAVDGVVQSVDSEPFGFLMLLTLILLGGVTILLMRYKFKLK